MTATRYPAATAALEQLAAALDRAEFALTLTSPPGQPPRLTVTHRHAGIGGDIYADDQAFWWSWSERISPVTQLRVAARKIRSALQPIPAARP